MKKILVLALSLVFAGGLLVSGPAFGQDKIKIGFIADMSGIGATFYKSQKKPLRCSSKRPTPRVASWAKSWNW